MSEHEVILAIVNQGYTETVMDAAREVGATGGTIIKARGTGEREAEKLFGLTVHPEKEIVLILTKKEMRSSIMQAIIKVAGLNTRGNGICFSLPVDEVFGTAFGLNDDSEENEEKQ